MEGSAEESFDRGSRRRGFSRRFQLEIVERYRSGEAINEILDSYPRHQWPDPWKIRYWFNRERKRARDRAEESWRPGDGWPEQRGQRKASKDDLRTFAELTASKPHGMGYSQAKAQAFLAIRHNWPHRPKTWSNRGRAWAKVRYVRFVKRKIEMGNLKVRKKTKEEAVENGLEQYDRNRAEWLEDFNVDSENVALQFLAESAARRLDSKYGKTPASKERDARAMLYRRLHDRLDKLEDGDGPPAGDTPALDSTTVDAEIVDD